MKRIEANYVGSDWSSEARVREAVLVVGNSGWYCKEWWPKAWLLYRYETASSVGDNPDYFRMKARAVGTRMLMHLPSSGSSGRRSVCQDGQSGNSPRSAIILDHAVVFCRLDRACRANHLFNDLGGQKPACSVEFRLRYRHKDDNILLDGLVHRICTCTRK